MAYTLSGTLKLPDGTAAVGVDIRFVSLTTFSPLIQQAEQTVRTGANGAYNIALEIADYNVFVTYSNNKPFLAGKITINSNTPTGQDLPSLLGGVYEPAIPAWITQVQQWLSQAQASATAAATSATTASQEAAKAKTQADRAQSEADRASQITGLSTVADAIGMAALPLPDVWAPLSDSLRMITGYGRDIMVGSDVIARMLGFSRSTAKTYTGRDGRVKIAAVNEPAFEAPGLLLEGASTNLIPSFPVSGSSVTIQKTTHPAFDIPVYRLTVAPGTTGYVVVPTRKLVSKYTASIWGMIESGSPAAVSLQTNYRASDGTVKVATVSLAQSSFTRRSVTCTNTVEGTQDNYINIINNGPAPCVVLVAGWQLEELPWASSYIQTNGAAATRAADILPLTAVTNFAPEGTYALEVFNARPPTGSAGRIFWGISASNDVFYGARLNVEGELAFFSGAVTDKTLIATGIEAFTGVMAFSVGRTSQFGPYTKQLPTSLPSSPMVSINIGSNAAGNDNIFCHVRNLRGWLKPLANEQIKAIK